MQTANFEKVTVQTTVNAPIDKVWEYWNNPEHITQWCFATPEWHAPSATNDLRENGKFTTRMEAKDGSIGFDFGGTYDEVQLLKRLKYTMDDGRKVEVNFKGNGNETLVVESFDAETQNPVEMQQQGWQAILDNFKNYAESFD